MSRAPNDNTPLVQRLGELLSTIMEEPLIVLPGPEPGSLRSTGVEIYVKNFRPELAEIAASLLEEAGIP